MSVRVLTQGGGAGGESASIFVTGLDENSTVKAVKNGKTVNGKWNSTENRFEFNKINQYGMYTVTAINGEDTVTQDVLVDAAVEYEIEMSYDPNYLVLYDHGDECASVTSGWTGFFTDSNYTTGGSYKKNADNLTLDKTANGYPTPAFRTNAAVSVLHFSRVASVSKWSLNTPTYGIDWTIRLSATTSLATNRLLLSEASSLQSTKKLVVSAELDLSSRGDSYVFLDLTGGYSGGSRGSVNHYAVAFFKPDNWESLCYKAGVFVPDELDALIADTAAISAILENESAVEFMVGACTGDFMALFVANAACMSALNNSPHKSVVFANKHWAKFLAMVGVTS